MSGPGLQSRHVTEALDALAPDGSEIRELATVPRGSMVHCTLPVGGVSLPVKHKTVDELWYVLSGSGQVWRRLAGDGRTADVLPGDSLNIPVGTAFQFRNTGDEPLCILIVTMPPWPGSGEAQATDGFWTG